MRYTYAFVFAVFALMGLSCISAQSDNSVAYAEYDVPTSANMMPSVGVVSGSALRELGKKGYSKPKKAKKSKKSKGKGYQQSVQVVKVPVPMAQPTHFQPTKGVPAGGKEGYGNYGYGNSGSYNNYNNAGYPNTYNAGYSNYGYNGYYRRQLNAYSAPTTTATVYDAAESIPAVTEYPVQPVTGTSAVLPINTSEYVKASESVPSHATLRYLKGKKAKKYGKGKGKEQQTTVVAIPVPMPPPPPMMNYGKQPQPMNYGKQPQPMNNGKQGYGGYGGYGAAYGSSYGASSYSSAYPSAYGY